MQIKNKIFSGSNRVCAATFFISSVLAACGSEHVQTSELSAGGGSRTVCRSQKVPKGWVIIENKYSADCGHNTLLSNNAYVIKKPENRETVCQNSDIPDDYVVVEKKYRVACGHNNLHANNAYVIEKAD